MTSASKAGTIEPALENSKRSCLLGSTDCYESTDAMVLKMDVPGLSKADVRVRISDGSLRITGSRPKTESAPDTFAITERVDRGFSRLFKLPVGADISKISASCDHGVLTVIVPKTKTQMQAPAPVVPDNEGNGSLNHDFKEIPISIFPVPSLGKLVIIDSSAPIIDALQTLSQYRILAAPVRDVRKPADAPWTDKYLGFVDMAAIVTHMLDKLDAGKAPEDFEQEIGNVEEFKITKVADLADKLVPFVPVDYSHGNLLDAMLLCGQHAIRRVPVVKTPGGDIVNIITQSALVQTLNANMKRFEAVGLQTMASLGLASPAHVYSVTTEDTLRTAFRLIRDYDISAVPVVDAKTGQIRGNVSARDVRLIAGSNKVYKLLNMPVRMFLDVISNGAENSAITCRPGDTLETVIKRLVHSRIHRIYVVDSQNRVIRVVSLRNVLRKFVKEPQGYFGHFFG